MEKFKHWDEDSFPMRKSNRLKNDIKRNKAKNNSSRSQGRGAAYNGGQGEDY